VVEFHSISTHFDLIYQNKAKAIGIKVVPGNKAGRYNLLGLRADGKNFKKRFKKFWKKGKGVYLCRR
jgi:hypothetical protein